MSRTMTLKVLNSTITVTVTQTPVGELIPTIESNLKTTLLPDGICNTDDFQKEAAIRAILDVIREHARNGIDVSAESYVDGIEGAILGL